MSSDWRERLGPLERRPLSDKGLSLHEAVAFGERRRGLAGLDALPPEVGLHIHRCNAIHTFGMRFPLDLLWLDRHGAVVRIDRGVPRRRQKLCLRAKTVVEVAAGGAGDGSLRIRYDALNSVTPVAISVDGTVGFERGPDGAYRKTEDTRDPYPRIVTGQYRPGRLGGIIDETNDRPVFRGAPPKPVRDAIDGVGRPRDAGCEIPGVLFPGGPLAKEALC